MIVITVAEGQYKYTSYVFSKPTDADNFCLALKNQGIAYHDNRPIAANITLDRVKLHG